MAVMALAAFAGLARADDAADSAAPDTLAGVNTAVGAEAVPDSASQPGSGAAARAVDTSAAIDGAPALAADTGAVADSAQLRTLNRRAAVYSVMAVDSAASFDPSRAGAADIFRGDAASLPEMMRYRPAASVSIPFALSNSVNRLLPYGNTAPVGYPASPALAAAPSLCYAPRYYSGDISSVQASGLILDPLDGFIWLPYPDTMASPELHIFWENGVFSQNALGLRLSRALSPNLMLGIFSNYRYFEGKRFDHEGNDIATFYEMFRSDTSTIMNRGYNPLTDEHALGANLVWYGADSSKLYASFTYSSLQNEYALNAPGTEAPSLDRLNWALLDRLSYRIDAALLDQKLWLLNANIKAAFINETITSLYEPDTLIANGTGETGSFIASADIALPLGIGAAFSGIVKNMEFFDGGNETYIQGDPELFYKHSFNLGFINTDIDLRAGMALFPWDDTLYTTPKAKAAAAFSSGGSAKLNLYAALDGITVYPDYDTSFYNLHRPGIDQFVKLGAEGTLTRGYFGATLGYQLTTGIDPFTVEASWPQGIPPYAQPISTITIFPWMSRFNGFSLLSRTFITDTKPYIKTSAALSYIVKPSGMSHTFETELGFDYWSERDPITFAGFTGWNDPIYDLNVKITAHIKTFRLFYKIDNLLNLRQAYVPGYFSPGLTFRWGINWLLGP